MKEVVGPGTKTGLILRLGQFGFALASVTQMVFAPRFSSFTAFCYLIASMALQVFWSFGLACLDVFALRKRKNLQSPVLVSLFVGGDWVIATLSLAAACSSAGIVVLYSNDLDFCKTLSLPCGKYQLSVTFAFLSWYVGAISSYLMLWILASI